MAMTTWKTLVLVAAGGLSLASCTLDSASSPVASAPPGLADTRWIVESLDAGSRPLAPAMTVEFVGTERLSGHDGCNSFSGAVTLSGTTIKVKEPMAGTMVACPRDIEERARQFREALALAAQFRLLSPTTLELADARGDKLMVLSIAPARLAGTEWTVIAYNNGQRAVTTPITGTRITAAFGKDGRLTGNGGCNNYSSSFTVSGNSLSIAPPRSTRRACAEPGGLMAQEARYLAVIAEARQFRFSGERLALLDAGGALLVSLGRSGQ